MYLFLALLIILLCFIGVYFFLNNTSNKSPKGKHAKTNKTAPVEKTSVDSVLTEEELLTSIAPKTFEEVVKYTVSNVFTILDNHSLR